MLMCSHWLKDKDQILFRLSHQVLWSLLTVLYFNYSSIDSYAPNTLQVILPEKVGYSSGSHTSNCEKYLQDLLKQACWSPSPQVRWVCASTKAPSNADTTGTRVILWTPVRLTLNHSSLPLHILFLYLQNHSHLHHPTIIWVIFTTLSKLPGEFTSFSKHLFISTSHLKSTIYCYRK